MTCFGWVPKDDVVRAIEVLAKEEHMRGRTAQEILESLLDATGFGIKYAMSEHMPSTGAKHD